MKQTLRFVLFTLPSIVVLTVVLGIHSGQLLAQGNEDENATVYDYSAGDGAQPVTSSDGEGMLAPGDAGGTADPCKDDPFANTDCVNRGSGTVTNPSGSVTNKPGTITNPGDTGKLSNPLQSKSIEEFILKIIDVLLVFAIPIIMLYIMYAGYLFVTARGDSGQISTARSALLWAVVGGVIVLGARVIIAVIQGTIKAF